MVPNSVYSKNSKESEFKKMYNKAEQPIKENEKERRCMVLDKLNYIHEIENY